MRKTANRLADSAASVGYMNGWNAAHEAYKVRIAELEEEVKTVRAAAENAISQIGDTLPHGLTIAIDHEGNYAVVVDD